VVGAIWQPMSGLPHCDGVHYAGWMEDHVDSASFDVLAMLRRSNADTSLAPAGVIRPSMVA
jgi:hypothetical protein